MVKGILPAIYRSVGKAQSSSLLANARQSDVDSSGCRTTLDDARNSVALHSSSRACDVR